MICALLVHHSTLLAFTPLFAVPGRLGSLGGLRSAAAGGFAGKLYSAWFAIHVYMCSTWCHGQGSVVCGVELKCLYLSASTFHVTLLAAGRAAAAAAAAGRRAAGCRIIRPRNRCVVQLHRCCSGSLMGWALDAVVQHVLKASYLPASCG